MTYYLETLTGILTTAGYSSVFYDYDNPSTEERIFLQNTGGGQVEANQPTLSKDFSIYIRRNNRATARTVADAIFVLLAGNEAQTAGILKITVSTPELFSVDVNSGLPSEFIINGTCLCLDNALNSVF